MLWGERRGEVGDGGGARCAFKSPRIYFRMLHFQAALSRTLLALSHLAIDVGDERGVQFLYKTAFDLETLMKSLPIACQ